MTDLARDHGEAFPRQALPVHPLVAFPDGWTDEQIAEFKAAWADLAERRNLQWLPPGPQVSLTPETVSQLLRECVTVVRPGEVLVLRCPEGWAPQQALEMQQHLNSWLEENAPGVKIMVVPHLDMAVIESPQVQG